MEVATEIVGLSPAEEAFFASGGETEIQDGEKAADPVQKTAEPEQKSTEATDKAGAGEDESQRKVTVAALHEERNSRREAEKQAKAFERELLELKGKFSVLDRMYGKPETQADKPAAPPKPEDDIFGAVNAHGQTLEQIQRKLAEQEQQTKAEREQQAFVESYRTEAARFEQQTPDFREAYNFLMASRVAELQALGYDSPQEIQSAIQADELAIAQLAKGRGKSAPELLYNLAKQRGYAKKDAAPVQQPAAEKLDRIRQGQEANKSLASTGGGAVEGEMTAEQLLKMDNDEFAAWAEKNPAKARRLMGG